MTNKVELEFRLFVDFYSQCDIKMGENVEMFFSLQYYNDEIANNVSTKQY